ncbi:MAG: hypothetical protein AB1751_09625 [Acidobacteriota bacterium]
MMQVALRRFRLGLAALFLLYGSVQALPHIHAQASSCSFKATPSSSSPVHRCFHCSIPQGQALAPESTFSLGLPPLVSPLPGESFTPAPAAFRFPGQPRAPPA